MATEQTPPSEEIVSKVELKKELAGSGFDTLGHSLAHDVAGIARILHDQKPLYLFTDCIDQPTGTSELIKRLLVEGLNLQAEESELIYSRRLDELDDDVAQSIIQDDQRPAILPIIVGSGDIPPWLIGSVWIFTNDVNVRTFRGYVEDLRGYNSGQV